MNLFKSHISLLTSSVKKKSRKFRHFCFSFSSNQSEVTTAFVTGSNWDSCWIYKKAFASHLRRKKLLKRTLWFEFFRISLSAHQRFSWFSDFSFWGVFVCLSVSRHVKLWITFLRLSGLALDQMMSWNSKKKVAEKEINL